MESQKKIYIEYSGSFVQTTSGVAVITLALGLIAAVIFLIMELWWISLAVAVGAFLWYLIINSLSKIIENLYIIRKIKEGKAMHEGYEVKFIKPNY